ncbi:uncharacterized protein BYT42DRAFT_500077 [Radiomyces spectabilis]|uniref:uncharacterized protein n=1 Tax=Radiomyces spectabilis TaxID=64574 RepID=UPI0022208985|nr:uncharacterized protein BYT42DRAFT_500077 [Radiomyces spectabilis]KAI8374577.1 hypothetical protein BYT42DRAFT_500077 [Radiomyces spectabilis]
MTEDYEYRIYDMANNMSDYGHCATIVMSRHQGFQWNEEVFVSAYRRQQGEVHKSAVRQERERRLSHSLVTSHHEQVVDIQLSPSDCDVWP